jgi:hypothetical protein
VLHDERVRAEVAEAEERRAAAEPAVRPTGRVVVEITQPPRRGRAASFGRDPDRDLGEAPAPGAGEREG